MSEEEEKVSNIDDLCEKIEQFEERLDDTLEGMFARLEKTVKDPELQFVIKASELIKSIEFMDTNINKFNKMINEFKGCIAMSRAVLQERKDLTPRWYNIEKIDAPMKGEIWIKDIDGNETIAACKGKAIIYPADSSIKEPMFWKPV